MSPNHKRHKLHELLVTSSLNLEEIRSFLECHPSSINEQGFFGRTPLLTALMNLECSIEIIRLLLQFGADVNVSDNFQQTPLLAAVENYCDEAIIEALLEKGANIEDREGTLLGYIFRNYWKRSENFEWKENVLNLLLKAGLELNKVIAQGLDEGKSPLCLALVEGADVRGIKLLLSKGGSLNACRKHPSPLHCVTHQYSGALLKASVVQMLLDKQARKGEVFEMGIEPLQNALRLSRYETAAIKVLLQHSSESAVNTWIRQNNNVLHWVVGNPNCKTSFVKLFLQRGARIDNLNAQGETVMHSCMETDRRDLSLIEFLLKSGAPVNVKRKSNETPLRLAVEQYMGNYVINLLLAFGARFDISCDRNGISLLEDVLRRTILNPVEKCDFKTLVKYYFLEFPSFNIQRVIEHRRDYEILSVFAAKCTDELQRMESKNVRSDCTLRRFISENFLLDVKAAEETKVANDDWKQLLKILSSNEFPQYFDVIASKMLASKLGEVFLQKNLQELIVYTVVDYCPGEACSIKKVMLNYDIVCNLALFLSDMELLRLIVAFYHADDLPCNNNAPKKRNLDSKQFTNFWKRRKLDQ